MRPLLLATALLLPPTLLVAAEPSAAWAQPAFSAVPAPGVHPRVIFSAADVPAWKSRLTDTAYGKALLPFAEGTLKGHRATLEELAHLPEGEIDAATVGRLWIKGESRNAAFFAAAALGVAKDDAALRQLAIKAITGYCRLTLRSREIGFDPKLKAMTGDITGSQVAIWTSKNWDVGTGFLFGGEGLALTYDMLYNEMTPEQRTTVRQAIAAALKGRRCYGLGGYADQAVSNHTLYHGHMAVMAMAIEGEEGEDPEILPLWKTVIGNYLDRSFYASGAANEDTYPVNTSLRDTATAMVGFARRGTNFFAHPHLQAHFTYITEALQPWEPTNKDSPWYAARFRGHGAGSIDGYPTIYAVARAMYPQNPVTNHLWRWYNGPDYRRSLRTQSLTDMLLFPGDADLKDPAVTDRSKLGLPSSVLYPERGLQITRSDWSDQALYVHFDARADAFYNGHDNADRGTFTVDALGRAWAIDGDWMGMRDADEHSLVRIDGKTQAWKPPLARFLSHQDRGEVVLSAADLTYCYQWQWSAHSPWPKAETTFPAPWEHETSDPRTLGFPDRPDLAYVAHTLYGVAEAGYAGFYYWKKPNIPVHHAFRSLAVRRAPQPYVVVTDDIALDAASHHYEWLLQLELDLTLASSTPTVAVLAPEDPKDERRLEIHALGGPVTWTVEEFEGRNAPGKGANKGKHMGGKRLIAARDGVASDFRMVLVPVAGGAKAPAIAGTTAAFTVGKDAWTATPGKDGRAVLTLNGK